MNGRLRRAAGFFPVGVLIGSLFSPSGFADDAAGRWDGPFCFPVQGTHMIHLHTGKMLIFPGHYDTSLFIEAWLWDFANPSKNCFGNQERVDDPNFDPNDPHAYIDYDPNPDSDCFTLVNNMETNLFCAGHAATGNGTVLITGGHRGGTGSNVGLADANLFHPVTETWAGPGTGVDSMQLGPRWYPTVTTLPDDTLLTTSGSNRQCLGGDTPGADCAFDSDCPGGGTCDVIHIVDTPEIFNTGLHTGQPNGWTALANTSRLSIPFYPLMFVLPDGDVFYAGSEYDQGNPRVTSADNYTLDLDTDGWTFVDNSGGVAGGSAVMYEPGKILKAGGMVPVGCSSDDDCGGDRVCNDDNFCATPGGNLIFSAPSAEALTIDMTAGGSKTWQGMATSMSRGRIRMNLTLLADGSALATGGNRVGNNRESNAMCVGGSRDGEECSKDPFAHPGSMCTIAPDPGKRAENCPGGQCVGGDEQYWVAETDLWNPDTGQWSQVDSISSPRMYHSTAVLLPDGRVVLAGGGQGANAIHNFHSYEIFTPPYLFDGNNPAARPTVSGVPEAVNYGQSFAVDTPDSAAIGKVGLVRLAAATHGFDQNQRYLSLGFQDSNGSLQIDAPADANLAPPGYYLLFLVDNDGVPAVGEYVRVSEAPVASCQDVTTDTDPGLCAATNVSVNDGSFDPGGDAIALAQSPDNPYPLGPTGVVLTVTDTVHGFSDACTARVIVEDNEDPTVTAPDDVVHECDSPGGCAKENVALGTPVTGDNCSVANVVNDAPNFFPLGDTVVEWTVTDASGNAATDSHTVSVVDTTPPELTLAVSPDQLWAPNHSMVAVNAAVTVSDICDPNPVVRLLSITSNELADGAGDGSTAPDIQGASLGEDDRSFLLRAERSGTGSGRVYTITYQAEDSSGNTAEAQATVAVAKNQSQ